MEREPNFWTSPPHQEVLVRHRREDRAPVFAPARTNRSLGVRRATLVIFRNYIWPAYPSNPSVFRSIRAQNFQTAAREIGQTYVYGTWEGKHSEQGIKRPLRPAGRLKVKPAGLRACDGGIEASAAGLYYIDCLYGRRRGGGCMHVRGSNGTLAAGYRNLLWPQVRNSRCAALRH